MKVCSKCRLDKSLDEFGNNKTKVDGKQTCCKACVKTINAVYYKATPEKNEARRAFSVKTRAASQQFVWDYLKAHPCVDCFEDDPIVLEFDHVSGEKCFNISDAIRSAYSVDKIETELAKCEVRCANCHRRITASRGNWYTNIDTIE